MEKSYHQQEQSMTDWLAGEEKAVWGEAALDSATNGKLYLHSDKMVKCSYMLRSKMQRLSYNCTINLYTTHNNNNFPLR